MNAMPWNDLQSWLLLLGVAVFYGAMVMLVRWNIMAKTLRNHLEAESALVLSRIEAVVGSDVLLTLDQSGLSPARAGDPQGFSLASAAHLLKRANDVLRSSFLDKIFWSRGQELTSLHCIREADRLLVSAYSPEEVRVHLAAVLEHLRRLSDPEAVALADRINEACQKAPYSDQELRAWLWEGMLYQGDAELGRVSDRIDLYNRTMWLTVTALLLMLVLGWVGGHPELFLAGAIGGLLGRLMRVLKENKEDTKGFGSSSWGTFFLSPLVGALVGWTGVLLTLVTGSGWMGAQGSFDETWAATISLSMLGLAVLFGLSEKYFDRLVTGAEEKLAGEPGAPDKPAAGKEPQRTPVQASS